MRIIKCKDYNEMSERAAEIVAAEVILKPNAVLGLATGSTPIGMYEELIRASKNKSVDFSKVVTFNLDEYYPIEPENEQSYHYYMKTNFFAEAGIKPENIHMPPGTSEEPEKDCALYDKAIEAAGGIDIQVLGIGQNGHIGFNEPGKFLESGTHLVSLTENTIAANSRFFESEEAVPRRAITMGLGSIMKAKRIVLLASGKAKHDALMGLVSGKINTLNPSTVLNMHKDAIIICDEEALNG